MLTVVIIKPLFFIVFVVVCVFNTILKLLGLILIIESPLFLI